MKKELEKRFAPEVSFLQKTVIMHPTKKDHFLLLIRNKNDKSRPGDFDIAGGSVFYNELHEDSLRREILEETNLEVENIIPINVKSRINKDNGHYFLYIGYMATARSADFKINPEEHAYAKWTTLEEFEKEAGEHLLTKDIKRAVSLNNA